MRRFLSRSGAAGGSAQPMGCAPFGGGRLPRLKLYTPWTRPSSACTPSRRVGWRFRECRQIPPLDFNPSFGSVSRGSALNQVTGRSGGWMKPRSVSVQPVTRLPGRGPPPGRRRQGRPGPDQRRCFLKRSCTGLLISGPGGIRSGDSWAIWACRSGGVGLSPAEAMLLTVDRSTHALVSVDLSAFFLPEVTGLEFLDDSQMSWSTLPVFAGYQLFRGDLSDLVTGAYGGCNWVGPAPPSVEAQSPPEGDGWFYLVAGKNQSAARSIALRQSAQPDSANAGARASGRRFPPADAWRSSSRVPRRRSSAAGSCTRRCGSTRCL